MNEWDDVSAVGLVDVHSVGAFGVWVVRELNGWVGPRIGIHRRIAADWGQAAVALRAADLIDFTKSIFSDGFPDGQESVAVSPKP